MLSLDQSFSDMQDGRFFVLFKKVNVVHVPLVLSKARAALVAMKKADLGQLFQYIMRNVVS